MIHSFGRPRIDANHAERFFDLLHVVADSTFAGVLCPLLVERIAEAAAAGEPDGCARYFLLVERSAPHLSADDKQRHQRRLVDLPGAAGIEAAFPLFTAALMRCVHALTN